MVEPEWDQADRDLAMGHDGVNLCPHCQGPAYLCQDPALQESWVAPKPIRCHRYTALLEQQSGVTEKTNPHMAALLWVTPHLRPEAVS